ncbi:uncharacterized protein Z518_01352 [Rhinocladiella mackenziei CBS 650.93]|uniref:Uncharacterized protein n=1 Tax=Rhinocladiella mackenziei CBS 650.93 TaxID=1442369 RepID=A0A0D2JLD3_9EURO|nr:uncharacterized protein Z518_01352 [Rhinocladiella mackenziei CBS 650.93]KIX10270.1 hypothetical protein Z518_01352 [Rhinocladiella mackenziei CBS 650.93]
MAAVGKKLALRTNPTSLTPKKYLGDPDDPHFIPDSPLIERQTLTAQEEGELKRICALVLANVPHSDDMSDDPLKYIATQIQGSNAPQQKKAKQEQRSEPDNATSAVARHVADLPNDTATPSETSNRDTLTTTDFSTPLTSAGLTPGESARRFSDAARKSITSTKKPGSSLRNETTTTSKSRTTSNAGVHKSLEVHNPSVEVDTIKRTLRLVAGGPSRPESSSTKSMDNPRPVRFSAPDLNKSLPPPPPPESPSFDDQKQLHISRLMKTIRKKKSMTAEGRNFSTTSAPPLPSTEEAKAAFNSKPHISGAPPSPPTGSQQPPKRKFRLRLFQRERPPDVLVS